MTRDEAIKVLQRMKYPYKCNKRKMIISNVDRDNEALDMAIQALNSLEEVYANGYNDGFTQAEVNFENDKALSSQSDTSMEQALLLEVIDKCLPESGKWIEELDDFGEVTNYHCSKCYEDTGFVTDCKWKFCPNCGAKMESEEISERNMKMWEEIFKAEEQ